MLDKIGGPHDAHWQPQEVSPVGGVDVVYFVEGEGVSEYIKEADMQEAGAAAGKQAKEEQGGHPHAA